MRSGAHDDVEDRTLQDGEARTRGPGRCLENGHDDCAAHRACHSRVVQATSVVEFRRRDERVALRYIGGPAKGVPVEEVLRSVAGSPDGAGPGDVGASWQAAIASTTVPSTASVRMDLGCRDPTGRMPRGDAPVSAPCSTSREYDRVTVTKCPAARADETTFRAPHRASLAKSFPATPPDRLLCRRIHTRRGVGASVGSHATEETRHARSRRCPASRNVRRGNRCRCPSTPAVPALPMHHTRDRPRRRSRARNHSASKRAVPGARSSSRCAAPASRTPAIPIASNTCTGRSGATMARGSCARAATTSRTQSCHGAGWSGDSQTLEIGGDYVRRDGFIELRVFQGLAVPNETNPANAPTPAEWSNVLRVPVVVAGRTADDRLDLAGDLSHWRRGGGLPVLHRREPDRSVDGRRLPRRRGGASGADRWRADPAVGAGSVSAQDRRRALAHSAHEPWRRLRPEVHPLRREDDAGHAAKGPRRRAGTAHSVRHGDGEATPLTLASLRVRAVGVRVNGVRVNGSAPTGSETTRGGIRPQRLTWCLTPRCLTPPAHGV